MVQPYTTQPYQEDEVQGLFRQLGMVEGMTPRLTQRVGRLEPRLQPRVGAGAPPQYAELLDSTPKAIEERDIGIFQAFWDGLWSPVTDTLSGFGVTEPRQMPTGLAGIVGNIAGSIIGWTGITMLTAGIGTKIGLVGAAAGKAGAATRGAGRAMALASGGKLVGGPASAIKGGLIGEATGGMMAKGALWGGLSQAHTWAFGQQEYENIPKDLLVGAAFGLGGGAIAGKYTNYLRQKGSLWDAPEVVRRFRERYPDKMIHIDNKNDVYQAYLNARSAEAYPMKQMMLHTDLTPDTLRRFRANLDGAVRMEELPDYLKTTVSQLKKAKNYGGIQNILKKASRQRGQFERSLRETTEGTTKKFQELPLEKQQLVANAREIEHKIKWAMGEHISTVVEGNPAVQLPNLKLVPGKRLRAQELERIQEDLKINHYTEEWIEYPLRVEEFLDGVNMRHKRTFRPFSTNFRDPSFLPVEEQDAYRRLIAGISGEDINVFPSGRTAFRLKEDAIPTGDIRKYLQEMDELPTDAIGSLSLLDELNLQGHVGWFTTKLAPVRASLGEGPFRRLRYTGQKYTQELGHWSKRVQDIANRQGWTTHRLRQSEGPKVFRVAEGDIGDAVAGRQVADAGNMVQDMMNRKISTKLITERIAREANLPKEEVSEAITRIAKLKGNDEINEIVTQLAQTNRLGLTVDGIWGRMYADSLYDSKLLRATAANAKEFNTTPKVLSAAQDARKFFNDAFTSAGLDPTMYRGAYMPHFHTHQGKESRVLLSSFRQIGLKEKEIDKIFWANEMHRDYGGIVQYDQNFFDTAERYIRGMLKKKHYEPVFEEMNKRYNDLNLHDTRREVFEGIKKSIVGVPNDLEKGMDGMFHNFMQFLGKEPTGVFKTRPTREMGAILAELQYSAGMGFNPFLPVRNLTQKALALSSITDSGNPIEGMVWMARWKAEQYKGTPIAKVINRSNDIITNRVFRESVDLQTTGLSNIAKRMGASDVRAAFLDDVMNKKAMEMFRRSDISNVQDVFGAKALYLMRAKGAPLADAAELARATTMATQFMYGIDSPMLYKTPIGKQIGIFQSWPLNWATMLWEQGTQGSMHRAAATITTMAVGAELLSMTGICFRSIHPTETAQGILPITMLEGEREFPLAFRMTSAGLDYMRSLANGEEEAVDTAINNFIRALEGLAPFGTITNRTMQFFDRYRHDWRDFEKPQRDFLNIGAAIGPNREGSSRLMRMLGPEEGKSAAMNEAFKAWFAPTVKSRQRQQDWEHASRVITDYQRMRRQAVNAFIDGDLVRFQRLQEQIVVNFGQWIEPHDIMQEMELMDMTSRERQLQGLPEELRNWFFEYIDDPRPER